MLAQKREVLDATSAKQIAGPGRADRVGRLP
jgi:hypothetical protein